MKAQQLFFCFRDEDMTPEIKIPIEKAPSLLLGLPCTDENCDGKLQTYGGSNGDRASCYRCGSEIDLESVKVIYENK